MSEISNIVKFIDECANGKCLSNHFNGPTDVDFSNGTYSVDFDTLDNVTTQPSQFVTDAINCTIRLHAKTGNHKDLFKKVDEAQAFRLQVANHLTAKKYGITTIEVGSLIKDQFGESKIQTIFEFSVRAVMSFNIT